MEDHETRRKIIREWMALPKDKRHTEEQVVHSAKKATQQNEFHRSRRDPDHFLTFPAGILIQGGVPIMHHNECVGAIGVSGVQSYEDEQIAMAGVSALG